MHACMAGWMAITWVGDLHLVWLPLCECLHGYILWMDGLVSRCLYGLKITRINVNTKTVTEEDGTRTHAARIQWTTITITTRPSHIHNTSPFLSLYVCVCLFCDFRS